MGSLETKSNARKAGISGPVRRRLQTVAKRRTGWLTSEDSNLHIPDWEMPFEMSRKFPHFPRHFGLETFAAVS
jgi:hypothetical protein